MHISCSRTAQTASEPQQPCAAGFFENKAADAKARGAPAPEKVQAENYEDFMSSLASDVRDLEAREEAAAEEAAQERADREAFEQRWGCFRSREGLRCTWGSGPDVAWCYEDMRGEDAKAWCAEA